jgi:hypothetical protein
VLFHTSDAAYSSAWDRALLMDEDSLYLVADGGTAFGPLVRISKAGGTPETIRPDVGVFSPDDSTLWDGALYSTQPLGPLTRYPLAAAEPSTTIAGADGRDAVVTAMIADGRGAYVSLVLGPVAHRLAFAPVPTGTNHASLLACTPASNTTTELFVQRMALTHDAVYTLAKILPEASQDLEGVAIYRAAR